MGRLVKDHINPDSWIDTKEASASDKAQAETERIDDLCYSTCKDCSKDLMFSDLYITHEDEIIFICNSCSCETSFEDFLSNLVLTEPVACVKCGHQMDIWAINCPGCNLIYCESDWLETIAFVFDIGNYYDEPTRAGAYAVLQEKITNGATTDFQKIEEAQIDRDMHLCFVCCQNKNLCKCDTASILTEDLLYIPSSFLDSVGWTIDPKQLPLEKYEVSCHTCAKQYTEKCEMIPSLMKTLNEKWEPAFCLDTCKYHEEDVEWSDLVNEMREKYGDEPF